MATLSIIEIDHNQIKDLWKRGHISYELYCSLQDSQTWEHYKIELEGLRKLGQRHHSETLVIEAKG